MIRYWQEVSGNVAKMCRNYGVSRPTYYKWLQRYEKHGIEGLRDGSSRPHSSKNSTR
jgi:transposase